MFCGTQLERAIFYFDIAILIRHDKMTRFFYPHAADQRVVIYEGQERGMLHNGSLVHVFLGGPLLWTHFTHGCHGRRNLHVSVEVRTILDVSGASSRLRDKWLECF